MSARPVPRILAQQYAKNRAELWLQAKFVSDLLVSLLDRTSRNFLKAAKLATQVPGKVRALKKLATRTTAQYHTLRAISPDPEAEYAAALARGAEKWANSRQQGAAARFAAYKGLQQNSTGLEGLKQLQDEVEAASKKISQALRNRPKRGQRASVGAAETGNEPTDDATPEPKLTEIPVTARQSSGYGWRVHPIKKVRKFHAGLDLQAATGTPVYASGDGVVEFAGDSGGYGNLIRLDHEGGLTTRYAHLSKIFVKKGEVIKAGELIGKVGTTGASTGPHLHFEVRVDGHPKDPRFAIPALA